MNEEEHKLDKVEEKLYSRNNTNPAQYRKYSLRPKNWETPKQWADNSEDDEANARYMKPPKNPFYKLLIGAFGFLIVSVLIAFFLFTQGSNNVSNDNINITIGGPIQIGGGQELALDVGVENKNSVSLQLVDVVVNYPDGTKSADDLRTDLKSERFNLGEIKSGGFARKIFKSALFGQEGSSANVKVGIEYRIPGSNAIFEKQKDFSITLSSSPVSITTQGIKEITSGQDAEFDITVTSNSESELKNILLKAEYPFGYSFKSADPIPGGNNDTWKLGNLSPKESRTIKVIGTLSGQDNEERFFKFTVGNADSTNGDKVGTILALSSQSVSISKPFIGMNLTLDDSNSSEYVVKDGQSIQATLSWVNNTLSTISNAEIRVNFSGTSLDQSSVRTSDGGFYDSLQNAIIWDNKVNPSLAEIKAGDVGKLNFNFIVRDTQKGVQQVNLDVGAKGQRVSESNVGQEINSSISRVVKLASDFRLASKASYFTGAFENSGPIPPKAEQETTYTINWVITNTSNDVSGAKVTATLPSYIKWNNLVSPSSEKISYDSVTGEVVWDVGSVPAGTGFAKSKKEVSFQITLKPSISQVDSSPVLVSSQILSGTDNFAGAEVKDSRSPLNTRLVGDDGFTDNDEKVQP